MRAFKPPAPLVEPAGELRTAPRASGSQRGGGRQEGRRPQKTQKQTSPAAGEEPPPRMPLGGPRTPLCGLSTRRTASNTARELKTALRASGSQKGGQTAGSPRPQEDPETDLACGRGKTSAPDAPGRPLEPRRAIFRPRKVSKDGWTSKEAGKGVRSGHRGNRGDGLWAGPAVGTAARRPETSEKPRRRPQGGLTPTRIRRPPGACIRRCPETGRNEPGQGGGPRKGAGNNPRRRSRE